MSTQAKPRNGIHCIYKRKFMRSSCKYIIYYNEGMLHIVTQVEAAKIAGTTQSTISRRLEGGWTARQVLGFDKGNYKRPLKNGTYSENAYRSANTRKLRKSAQHGSGIAPYVSITDSVMTNIFLQYVPAPEMHRTMCDTNTVRGH